MIKNCFNQNAHEEQKQSTITVVRLWSRQRPFLNIYEQRFGAIKSHFLPKKLSWIEFENSFSHKQIFPVT